MTTPLYPTFQKRISDSVEQLLQNKVTPWTFLNSGKPFRVEKFNGREIAYEGVGFEGSPREVFWARYIEPFLEELAVREIDEAVSLAHERDVDAKPLLLEVQGLLRDGSGRVFTRMAEIDQRLRENGYPGKAPLRRVEHEVQNMDQFIEKRIQAELAMWKAKQSEQRRTHRAAANSKPVQINIGELKLNMGDKYTAGQVGAMGPQAHAHDVNFHQVNAQQLGYLDLQTLAAELATLRREMQRTAVEAEQAIAIGQIAAAEAAAQKGDANGVSGHLKSAGKWAFDVATKVGVSVASEAIKKSLGM